MLLVTTAMKPLSDFTTPRRLIALISRHFLPVEQPDPFCCTTGLKNGSRFPFIAHFFSSALGLAASAGFAAAGAGAAAGATTGFAGAAAFASCFGADFGAGVAAFATAGLTGAGFAAAGELFAIAGAP